MLAAFLVTATGGGALATGQSKVTVVVLGDCFPGHHFERFIGKGVDPFEKLRPLLAGANASRFARPRSGQGCWLNPDWMFSRWLTTM
jgi:hypothetical protein